ncbi:MAG: monomethylamine:corrinoid methyltransferase, partial [Deltaproteobacteria bacterium]|nr:monomethylamine:corrinoid methyltransferase [Deltaproteobacteria bacterium]
VFQAGVELLGEVGLYHMETQRVIKYTVEEIRKIADERKADPGKVTMGLGDDEVTIQYRTGEDSRAPTNYAGAAGVLEEEWFMPFVQSIAQEESVKGMGCTGGITRVGDVDPKAGTLSELHCGLWEQNQMLEVLRRVGRPGMSLGLMQTVTTPAAIMECIGPGLREAHNTHIGIHILPEQKIDWTRLIMAHFCQERGITPWQSAMSMIGGFCRDAADNAVVLIANTLGQMSYGHGPISSLFSSLMDGSFGTRETIWAVCAAARASERNIRVATGACLPGSDHCKGIQTSVYVSAAEAVAYTACGLSYAWVAGCTGLEARLIGEILDVTAGMDKNKADKLVKSIMGKVDDMLGKEPPMVHFTDKYDVKTIKPKPEYETKIMQVKEELARMGMPFG